MLAVSAATEFVREDDFYRSEHKKVFAAIMALYERGEAIDYVTVCDELKAQGQLEEVGGPAYMSALMGMVPTAANIATYARIVQEKALLRRLISAAFEIGRIAAAPPAVPSGCAGYSA